MLAFFCARLAGSLNTSASAVGDGLRLIFGGPSIADCGGPDDGDVIIAAANIDFAMPTMVRRETERGDLQGDCCASVLFAIAEWEAGNGSNMG